MPVLRSRSVGGFSQAALCAVRGIVRPAAPVVRSAFSPSAGLQSAHRQAYVCAHGYTCSRCNGCRIAFAWARGVPRRRAGGHAPCAVFNLSNLAQDSSHGYTCSTCNASNDFVDMQLQVTIGDFPSWPDLSLFPCLLLGTVSCG